MSGSIKGITIEFNGDTTKLDSALRKIDAQTRSLDKELRNVDKALKFKPGSVDLWSQKQNLLKQRITETKTRLDALKQAQAKMDSANVDKNSEEYRRLQREIALTEGKLKGLEKELRQIGNVKLHALGEQFKAVGAKMTETGKNLTMKVTAPLAAVGAVAVNKFAEVDKTMQLTNATMGNTETEAQLLNKAMKEAAASSTYGMNDAATATLNFARAGLTAEEAAAALAPAMALAAGEGGELDTVSAGLVATINGFHGSFDEASTYADVFANACNNSALDVNSLADAMSVAAPIFSAAGYSVNDAALYMGVMANNGIEADKAANSLKTGMARLISPSAEAASWMDKLHISMTNADGTMKDTVTVQKELHSAFSQLSESEQIAAASAIFGKNQMAPWLALINTAPGDVDKLNTALMEEGTAMEMQGNMMKGFGGSIEQLKSGVDVLATSFGEALAPMLQVVIKAIQRLVDWFNNLSPRMQSVIAAIALVVAAIGPVLVILGTLASSIGSIISVVGMIAPLIGGVTGAIGGLMSGALLPIVGVVAAVVAAGILLYKNWDTIKAKAIELKTKVVAAFNELKSKMAAVWKAITAPITNAVNTIRNAINKIKSIINGAKLSLPKFKLPHFNISAGKLPWGIGGKGTPPKISVSWYAEGGIFDSASLIGVGEKGPEAVVPLDTFWDKMDAIAAASTGGGSPTINIYAQPNQSPRQIAEEVERVLVRMQKQRNMAYGGI